MANISRKKLNDFLEETKKDLSSQRAQDNTQKTVRQSDLDSFFSDFRKALDETYTPEVLEEIKAEREARTASLRPGETRRGSRKTESGETIPGARWEPQNRQVNATVRSAEDIRKDLAAVDEEIKAAKIWRGNGLVGGSNPSDESNLSALETNRERLRQELAANRNALKNNADYVEKNQADAGYAAMTDDAMYRLVNYPDQENDLVRSPAQGDIKVNETLKSLIDPIFSAVYNDSQYIKSMTDEERQTYNYIYKTEGRESADEYLDLIKEGLTKRSTQETGARMEQFAEEHPVLSSAYTVATLPAKGASALGGSLGTYLSGKELDRNASYNALANTSSGIRGTVSKQVEEKWGKVGSFAYDVGMSMADFLAMGVIGKGSQIPMMILGSNAAADMTISALERGLSDGKALSLGLVAGIAEAAAEKIGIDRLFKNQNWNKNSLLYILQNVFGELLEEGGTSLVNSLADILISRDQSEWQQSINAYREQGFTDKEAFDNTLKDTAIMIGLDMLGGAISGGLMGGSGVAIGKIGQGAVNRENVREAQETWREVRKENERSQAAKTAAAIETNGFEETGTEEPIIISRPSATTEGEEFEIGREVRRDQLMTLEQQEKADAIDAAEDDLTATALKYGATPRQINEARELSELTGYSVEFFRQKNPNGTTKNGMYDPRSRRIYLNVNSKRTVATTIAHEITHSLEDSASYEVLHDLVLGIKQVQGTDIDAERAEVRNLYEKAGKTLKGNREIDADIVAEYVGTELLDDVRAIREVYRENPSVGRKIASVIDKMLIKATGMQDMTVKSYLERASAMYQQAEKIAENAGEAERLREENEKAQRMTETARATGRSFATKEMEDRARDLRRRTYVKANELEVDRKEAAQRRAEEQKRRAEEQKKETERKQTIRDERLQRTYNAHEAADKLLTKMLKDYQSERITEREFELFLKKYEKSQRKSERYAESAIRRALSGEISEEQFDENLEWSALMRDPAYNRREKNLKDSAEAEEAARNGSDAEFLRYITERSEDLPRWKLDTLLEEYANRQESAGNRTKITIPEGRPVVDAYRERQEARERGESDWSNIETNPSRMVPQNAAEPATEESAAEYLRRISLEVPESERGDLTAVADEAEITQQSAKKAADAIRISAYDAFDNDEIDEETRDARLNLADEIEFTGRGIESSADIVDYPEGRIPEWVRGKAGAIREKLGIKPKEPVQYSISAEEDSEGNSLTEEQARYFAYSKIRDDGYQMWDGEGNLVPVYHGTDSEEFTVFDRKRLGEMTAGNATDEHLEATAHVGFWFSTQDLTRHKYSPYSRSEKVYLNIENPRIMGSLDEMAAEIETYADEETARDMGTAYRNRLVAEGYDGIIITSDQEFGGTSFVAFEPNQIKRTNNLTPSLADDIRYSVSEDDDQTRTPAFKRWFGDWENDPANASKIVNADGTPKVMYHGSRSKFYEFSHDKAGGLFHFTPQENSARNYAVGAGGARSDVAQKDKRLVDYDGNVYEPDENGSAWFYVGQQRDTEKWWDTDNLEDVYPRENVPDVLTEYEAERLVAGEQAFVIPKTSYTEAFYINARNPLEMNRTAIPVLREIYRNLENRGQHSNALARTLNYLIADMDMWPATKAEAYSREWQNLIVPELKQMGYDAIMFRDDGHDTVAVFDPTQIKSATGNIGTFDPNDPDVRFSISEEESSTPYGNLPVKAQNRVRDLERKFGVALDKMFGLGMTYKSPDFRAFLQSNVRPLVNAYLENGIIPEEESDALFAQFFDPATGADEVLQKQEFYNAFEEMEEGLFNVARWSQSQTAVPETDREESPIPTTEEAEQLFTAQRDARREMDKVMYRVLLKPEDEVTVGKLLRGDLSPDQVTENKADILEAYRVQKAFRDADAAVSVYKKRLKAELYKHVDKYLGNIAQWKDKRMPLMYQRETMERNIRDIIPDKAEADAFIAEFITPVHRAEAQRQRFLGEYRDRVKKLNLSTKVQEGNQQSEAYAVQFLGEAADNIRILSLSGKLDQQRDGHTLEEWKAAVEAFWAANPNMNRAKIDSAIGEFRQIYNELLPKLNKVRIRNGYAPVAFRQGYFPHFTATSEDTVLARILRPFGIEFNADALPTSINGLTADFKPGITYFQFGNERLGFETTYDALQGYEMYLNAASDVIYHTDNIQKLRALAARIRYLTGDEGVKQQIDKVRNNDTLDEAEKQVQLEEIYRKGRYRMSNFVVTMDEYTNGLANKKSRFDRGVEELFGRPAYSVMKALENRVASNMIAGNLGSALTNIIPLNQANAIIGNVNVLKGMYHTIHGMAVHDGFAAASDFLTNRRGADPLVRTFGQKLSDKASIPMNLIDGFVSETIVRAAYIKNLADGMGEDLALQHADALAASIMADRSKGALPVLFNARNPLMKLFTQFQVEVNNEYSVIFKDIPELAKANSETKAGAIARITGMLFRYFVGAWLFNEIYEKLFGRRAALDPVGMIANTVGSVAEGEDVGKALQTLGTEAAESLPFVGGVLGGGRVPIQSAIPNFADLTMAATSDTWTGEKKALTAFEELSKPAAYLLPPFLGGQIQKTLRGIAAAAQGGVYGIEGDEDGGAYLKYPVYDDPLDVTRSVLFGTTYTEGGREWVESGFKSLSVSQTAAYQAMKEFGADDRAAFDLIEEYKSVPTGEGRTAAQRDVIRTADIPGKAKFAAYYNLGASDSRKELMDSIEAAEPRGKLGEAAQVLMDISDIGTGKTAGTCDLLAQSGLSEDTKKLIYRKEVSDQKDDDIRAAELVGISFDEYLDAHAAYSTLYNDKTLSKSEQALEFSRYVDGTNLMAMQKDTLRDIFKFYSQVPVSAKNYNELRNLGISDDYAAKITRAIDALEPLPGKKSVSDVQKARVVVDAVSDPDERLAALGTVLSDSQYRKVSIAANAGLDPEVWVAFREILPEFDSDANGSYTQEEMEDAIRAFSSGTSYGSTLMKQGRNLSRDEMAILWQIGGNWKSANNPFSKPTGKKVKDLLDAEKKG